MKYLKESKLEDQTDRFQLTMEPDTEPHQWADQAKTRKVIKPEHMRSSEFPRAYEYNPGASEKFNYMPPGMDGTNQHPDPTERAFPLVSSMDTGTEGPMTQKNRDSGYKRLQMSQTEEDADKNPEFFGEAPGENDGGDKITGFLERRNVTDRN